MNTYRKKMKIAIPVHNDCVSSVFDFAREVLLADIDNGEEVCRSREKMQCELPVQRVAQLKKLGVDIVVCGAVSRVLADLVLQSGMQLYAYVTGPVNDVMGAFFDDRLTEPQFSMPGCRRGSQRRLRRRRGCGRRDGRNRDMQ